MEELEIQGKKYISSKRAAELTGYAKDYVGQLSREGKIPATRVGRSWYVDERAVIAHAKGGSEEIQELPREHTAVQLRSFGQLHYSPENLSTWSKIEYFADDSELIPRVLVREDNKTSFINTVPVRVEKRHQSSQMVRNTDSVIMREPKAPVVNKKVASGRKKTLHIPYIFYITPAFLLIVGGFIALGGVYTPQEWVFSQTTNTYAAGALNAGLDAVFLVFGTVFYAGIDLLRDFFGVFVGSLADFFTLGLDFLVNLF